MDIQKFEVGPFAENTYLLTSQDEHLLIDPGFSSEPEFQHFKQALKGELKAIVLTHAHVDHVMGVSRTLRDFDVPVYLSDADRFLWNNFGSQAQMFGLNQAGFNFEPEALPKAGTFQIGNFEFNCLYTPGHSPDHISLYFEEDQFVIAGDALFKESIGRTDLYKGDFSVLEKSIKEKLYTLPDETVVYPGHGPSTTIAHEKTSNAFVKA
ncbi:MBL fold metallo-hydrolase [Gracilimonas tropica]|uniref:MBL fold metallo-hydrolase n=1 Tax=Gracilimonas tropica TaxID=454600 RepID=UPI00035D623A|nr:MBL fold metallo-hydrolase [Gracilimonas tropica]